MDYLYLRFGMEVCLRSQLTQKYLGYNEKTEITSAVFVPPYIELSQVETNAQHKLPSLKLRIQSRDAVEKGSIVTFGSRIFLIDCQTGSYLTTVSSKSAVGFDKPGLHEGMNSMLQKSATFIVLDQKNILSKQAISVYDLVHFKSVVGTFLICLPNGAVNISGDAPKPETAWNIMKADTPYIPAWVYQRPTFSKFLNLGQIEVDPVFGNKKKELGSEPVSIQQMKLVEDILDVMLGFDGQYIKKNSSGSYSLEPYKQRPTCSMALAQLTKKILALPSCYCVIENYISTYSIQQGTVCQALCSGLREMVKQYKQMAIAFDQEVSKRGLTLQQIWYYIQPSLQLMQSIVQLLKEARNKKGGQLLTSITKMLNGTTSQQVVKTYTFLFKKCLNVYIQIISKWIYEGLVEDKYEEFMIMEEEGSNKFKPGQKQKNEKEIWGYWEEKFILRREQIPQMFEKDAHIILVTGKYLNIIRMCSGLEAHPFHKEIQKNMEKHMKNQDFTQSIMRAYNWANERLQNLIIKQFKFTEVLESLKGYYFLGFGDLFVHFMDSAEEDLNAKNSKYSVDTKSKPVSVQKLQNLFQLLIRTSSANGDPYKQQITCRLQNNTIYEQVHKIKTLQFDSLPSDKPFIKKQSKNIDYFNLDFNCQFPLNLIINKKNLGKYQVLFRYLFWCKFIERQLNNVWMVLQCTKIVKRASFQKANLLTQKMLNFVKSLIYYLSYEVIQKNWLVFMNNLQKISSLQDIINYHNQFLNKCLQQSLLLSPQLLLLITGELGSSLQGFIRIKEYVDDIFSDEYVKSLPDPKQSTLQRRLNRRKQIQSHFESMHEEAEFEEFMFGYTDVFDKNMKKLLREIYNKIGKEAQNSHLMGLLDTLDPTRFYNKFFFGENRL